ncbi:MAG: hypothetical protein WCD18_04020 [Thermosynechococcaceae cyanobacterium]
MAIVENKLGQTTVFNSFFGPVTLEPGLNEQVHDQLWKNLKKNNPDVKALLQKELLVEVNPSASL